MNDHTICGLDEAGRGSLAGPLVAAGVVLTDIQSGIILSSGLTIRDSKTLSPEQRQDVFRLLSRLKIPYVVTKITAGYINRYGIQKANIGIFLRIIKRLPAGRYIADRNLPLSKHTRLPVISTPHADATHLPVILAGIAAKFCRDRHMRYLSKIHPEYGWQTNAGYGTKAHVQAIRQSGTTPQHRTLYVNTALSHCTPLA